MRIAVILAIAFAISTPAGAASTIEDVTNLDIAVNGTIGQHCALGSIAGMDFGKLGQAGLSARARVPFDCNVPFVMTIKGNNGALTNTVMPSGQGPYSGRVPYVIGIELPVRHPSAELVSKSFEGRQIQGGASFSSNGGIATDDMVVAVELGAASGEAGLLAGDYSETITITVSPS